MRSSYRSKIELTKFANSVLKRAHPAGPPAIPFARHGAHPVFSQSESHRKMVEAIVADIAQLRTQNVQSIGVLCKTEFEANRLVKALRQSGVHGLGASDNESSTSVLVAPIYAVRGMEFDAMIVANASKVNYRATALHNRLLYLAVTRAAHQLHVHWFGALASALEAGHASRQSHKKAPQRVRARHLNHGSPS